MADALKQDEMATARDNRKWYAAHHQGRPVERQCRRSRVLSRVLAMRLRQSV
jgi:hypothetical protein